MKLVTLIFVIILSYFFELSSSACGKQDLQKCGKRESCPPKYTCFADFCDDGKSMGLYRKGCRNYTKPTRAGYNRNLINVGKNKNHAKHGNSKNHKGPAIDKIHKRAHKTRTV